MHMADALISPAVGGVMLAATVGVAAYSIKKTSQELDDKKIPLMGVMGAFVFAAQMINFTIPGTGSSGHIGGGMLLAALLGPAAGFLTMASILLIQALFFADGGLLALGSNVFNMGFYSCFIAFPLIYKLLMRKGMTSKRIFWASLVSVVVGLQLGAFSVVLQTLLSGKTELPFYTFALMMQPIHLAIGVVEGLITAAVLTFVFKMRPEVLDRTLDAKPKLSMKKLALVLVVVAVLVGGAVSWFASSNPDGLEWAMIKTAGTAELEAPDGIHTALSSVQESTAILPDYSFKAPDGVEEATRGTSVVNAGTSVSGLVGGALTLALAVLTALGVTIAKRKKNRAASA